MGARRTQDYLQRPAEELYDLENDPEEVKNLAGDPRHAELIKKFRGRLLDFQKRTEDPWARSAAEWGEFLFGSGSDPNRVPGN